MDNEYFQKKMNRIIILFFGFSTVLSLFGQETDNLRKTRFNIMTDVGLSYLFQWDQSYLSASSLTELDSRLVLKLGVGTRWNILEKAEYKPKLGVNLNVFRSKASDVVPNSLTNTIEFRNTFIAYNAELTCEKQVKVGTGTYTIALGGYYEQQVFLLPYAMKSNGEELKGFEDLREQSNVDFPPPGGPFYRGPINIGSVLGVSKSLGKLSLGLFYHQRLYFLGVNREISRLSLRVGF